MTEQLVEMELVDRKEILRDLDQLDRVLKTKAVRSGLTEVSKPIRRAMKSLAPRRTGLLRRSIGTRNLSATAQQRLDLWTRDRRDDVLEAGTVAVLIGPNRRIGGVNRARIAALLEFGTKSFTNKGTFPGTRNPGIRARRFMGRALDVNLTQVERLFFRGMARRLDELSSR